jgi:translation initiation factor IF-1
LAKEELLTLGGQIDEIYPDGRFGVMLENDHRIIAYTAGKMRRFRIRSVVGDLPRTWPWWWRTRSRTSSQLQALSCACPEIERQLCQLRLIFTGRVPHSALWMPLRLIWTMCVNVFCARRLYGNKWQIAWPKPKQCVRARLPLKPPCFTTATLKISGCLEGTPYFSGIQTGKNLMQSANPRSG